MRPNPFENFDFFTPIRMAVLEYVPDIIPELPAPTCRLLGIDVAHRKLSLTDAQLPEEQLRFFQSERVFRFLRDLAIRFKKSVPDYRTLLIYGSGEALTSPPVRYFLSELDRLAVRYETGSRNATRKRHLELLSFPTAAWLSERFSVGDTWSTLAVIEKYPDVVSEAEGARLSGIGLALQGKTEEAERKLERWRELGTPANQAWALYSLAMLYARHHRPEKRSLDAAEEKLGEAYRILANLDEKTPDLTFYRAFNRNGLALIHFRRGDVHGAREILRRCILAISNDADHLRLHKSVLIYNLAQCEVALGNASEAKAAYRDLLSLDPDYAENRIEYANLLVDSGEDEAAFIEVDRAISLDPSIGAAWAIRARLALAKGELENAVRDFDRAIRLAPEDASLRIELAEAYVLSGRLARAEAVLNELTDTGWARAPIETQEDRYVIRAEIALTENKTEQAAAILQTGLTRFPYSSVLQENLSYVAEHA